MLNDALAAVAAVEGCELTILHTLLTCQVQHFTLD